MINEFSDSEIEKIDIYPIPTGGVQLEYVENGLDIEIEILDYDISKMIYTENDADIMTIESNYLNTIRKMKIQNLL